MSIITYPQPLGIRFRRMIHSFRRKGNPYDNACIESFHSRYAADILGLQVSQTML